MMIALAFIGTMLVIGVILRAKIPFLRKMLVPASVLAGIVGFINLNLNLIPSLKAGIFTNIVNELFTLSFISIGLTTVNKEDDKKKTLKNITKGAFGMGIIWCILYAFTPFVAGLLLLIIGNLLDINPMYGLLVQFGFAQGPGQAASFGTLFEQYGFASSSMIGITFAVCGFLSAFIIGVLIVKRAIKIGLIKKQTNDLDIEKGYYKEVNKGEVIGYATTYSGNIETVAFSFGIMGICYLLALLIAKLFTYLPGFLGSSMSGMMFMNGLFAAYIVKFIMKNLKIDYLLNNILQSRITGFLTDFVVASSFMAIRISVIGKFIIPILLISIITAIITLLFCLYFGRRIGNDNDFERTLGLFGTCTGTVSSGIALVRMVNPTLSTTTSIELGMMNLPMMLSTPVYLIILGCVSGEIAFWVTLVCLFVLTFVYIGILKIFKCFNKPTYSWKEDK